MQLCPRCGVCPNCGYRDSKENINAKLQTLSNEKILEYLSDNIDNNDLKDIRRDVLSETDEFGQTLLHLGVVKADLEVIKFLVNKMKLDTFDWQTKHDGYTALHLAVLEGNIEIIFFLIKESEIRGIDNYVDITDFHGRTALHIAAESGYFHVCKKLLTKMSKEAILLNDNSDKQNALHFSVIGGYNEIVELLLSNNEYAKNLLLGIDKYNQTVLHMAASFFRDKGEKIAETLIDKAKTILTDVEFKAFLFQQKNEGYTALMTAAQYMSTNIIKKLVETATGQEELLNFAKMVDEYGQTALHWAADRGNLEACRILCNAMDNNSINIQTNERKQTALYYAVQREYYNVADLLIKSGARKDIIDKYQKTAMDWIPESLKDQEKEFFKKLLL